MFRFVFRSITMLFVVALLLPAIPASAAVSIEGHFDRTWERTDRPVASEYVGRTWMWGPRPFTPLLNEPYAESPDNKRLVQYFDKSRMEITNPNGDSGSVWYVTNGLLSLELITGRMQVGNDVFEHYAPAHINVAGDAHVPTGPVYASFSRLLDAPPLPAGTLVIQRIDREGNVFDDPGLSVHSVGVGQPDELTGHAIADPFWRFMTSSGTVYEFGGFTTATLFGDPYFATGRPITGPYWANVAVAGISQDVLVQCFERRCLTYTPANPPDWQVEAGNVGQHYYSWRYNAPVPDPPPLPEPPPAPEPAPVPQVAPPSTLSIPKIGVNAPVEYVATDALGRMGVPVNYWNVAWYQPGTVPGQPGNAVIAGHVDSAQLGPVVFWNLRNLVPGDYVYVTTTTGATLTFVVTEVASYHVDSAPLQRIFGGSTDRNLNLITCEGYFDPSLRDYDQRRVVYTTLVD
jgi:LPXTG-site transpeptidase (sortase) family protein